MYYALVFLGKGSSNMMLGVVKGIIVLIMQWEVGTTGSYTEFYVANQTLSTPS